MEPVRNAAPEARVAHKHDGPIEPDLVYPSRRGCRAAPERAKRIVGCFSPRVGDRGPEWDFERLNRAFRHIMEGAEFVALQRNR